MDKPVKPNLTFASSFGGEKENFSASKIANGYESDVRDILGGANLNHLLDFVAQKDVYHDAIADYINALPIGKTITVDSNNKLVYQDLLTDVSNKANVDLDNLTQTGKNRIAIKEYLNNETYLLNDVVLGFVNNKLVFFRSRANNNVGNDLDDAEYWEQINLGGMRNVGELVESVIPLSDASLHLIDGALINGSGIYSEFVDYIADKYENSPKYINVETHGSLVNNNGVISGFSTVPSYFVIPNLPTSWTTFETKIKFTTGSSMTPDQAIISYGTETNKGFAVGISSATTGNKIYYYASSNGSTWDIADGTGAGLSSSTVSANTTYYMKVYFTGTAYKVDLSTDDINYTNYINVSSTTAIYKPSWIDFGVWFNNNTASFVSPFTGGSIDLNKCSLSFDNKAVWHGMLPIWCGDEFLWQYQVNTTGVCAKFVYDDVANTVRLPKITGFIEGTTDLNALGEFIEAGLPQHTHTRGTMNITGAVQTTSAIIDGWGALYGTGWSARGEGASQNPTVLNIDASRSWTGSTSNANYTSTLQTTNTVQPQAVKVFYYICIATTSKTAIEVDIDEIATDLNGKADIDLTNCTKPHIIETYQNGSSWYRVYSDGWCEQGGISIAINSVDSSTSVSLLKSYRDTNYSCQVTIRRLTGSYGYYRDQFLIACNISTNGFYVYNNWAGSGNGTVDNYAQWRAEGYIS